MNEVNKEQNSKKTLFFFFKLRKLKNPIFDFAQNFFTDFSKVELTFCKVTTCGNSYKSIYNFFSVKLENIDFKNALKSRKCVRQLVEMGKI